MNYLKFLTGLVVLALAFLFQFWFGIWGFYGNFVFAALIAFAFLFEIWQFIVLLLLAILVLNWQPGFSLDIIVFSLIPLAVSGGRRLFRPDPWAGTLISLVGGLCLLYVIISPGMIVHSFGTFFVDILLSTLFGVFIIWTIAE